MLDLLILFVLLCSDKNQTGSKAGRRLRALICLKNMKMRELQQLMTKWLEICPLKAIASNISPNSLFYSGNSLNAKKAQLPAGVARFSTTRGMVSCAALGFFENPIFFCVINSITRAVLLSKVSMPYFSKTHQASAIYYRCLDLLYVLAAAQRGCGCKDDVMLKHSIKELSSAF